MSQIVKVEPTAEQKRLANAWVDEICGKCPSSHPDDPASQAEAHFWAQEAEDEYHHALAILMFTDAEAVNGS